MIEDLIASPQFRRYVPYVGGLLFIILFLWLSLWQLDRAAEKKDLLDSFGDDAPYLRVTNFDALDEFERIQVDGHFLGDRQVLIDNILINSRPGFYVITPFQPAANYPLLLVNRGWLPKDGIAGSLPIVDVDEKLRTIHGLVGHLPRVAIRPGEAFAGSATWPRVALYPSHEEVAAALGSELLPTLLLLAPGEDDGFTRQWQPNISGPATHYGYAFQWFAMALAAAALLTRHARKRIPSGNTDE